MIAAQPVRRLVCQMIQDDVQAEYVGTIQNLASSCQFSKIQMASPFVNCACPDPPWPKMAEPASLDSVLWVWECRSVASWWIRRWTVARLGIKVRRSP